MNSWGRVAHEEGAKWHEIASARVVGWITGATVGRHNGLVSRLGLTSHFV